MTATVAIKRWTGVAGGPTKTTIDAAGAGNTVVNASDSHQTTAAGSSNPIKIPTVAGTNRSFWCCTRLSASVAPTGTINNLRWYTDGTNSLDPGGDPNAIYCKVARADKDHATPYVQATGTTGTSGTLLSKGNYAALLTNPVTAFTHTSGSPLSVDGSQTSTGDFGDFVVYQFEVNNPGASAGTTNKETFTWLYDET